MPQTSLVPQGTAVEVEAVEAVEAVVVDAAAETAQTGAEERSSNRGRDREHLGSNLRGGRAPCTVHAHHMRPPYLWAGA